MSTKQIILTMHPPTLSSGKIKIELDPLPASVLKCLLLSKDKRLANTNDLAACLEPLGFVRPDFLKIQEVLKALRKALQVMGVDNPVLRMGDGLMLNPGVSIQIEGEGEPDLLDTIYNDLMSN